MRTSNFYDPIRREWTTNPKYQEILKLDEMLTEANIPHTLETCNDGWRVCYPTGLYEPGYVMDVDEHFGSYGSWEDKLEISGLLTPKEEQIDYVAGFLDAEDVFNRIKEHWDKNCLDFESDDICMSSEEFADEMLRIRNEYCDDIGVKYRAMQDLICDLLVNLGYSEGIDIFLDLFSEVDHEYQKK